MRAQGSSRGRMWDPDAEENGCGQAVLENYAGGQHRCSGVKMGTEVRAWGLGKVECSGFIFEQGHSCCALRIG